MSPTERADLDLPFEHETPDGIVYVVPMRRLWIRWLLLHRLCELLEHDWRLSIPPNPRIRSRAMHRCHRCGLLRWSWPAS